MIQLSDAGKRFGPKILFEGLNWLVTQKERVGIVGANGTGKSTLLKVLAGIEGLDYGSISAMKGLRAGYLPQDGIQLTGRTVFAECLAVFHEVHALEAEQQELARRMSELDHSTPEYQQIAERYHQVQSEFTARDGYNIESRVGSVLTGLGFSREDWQKRVEAFSGGWQMRIALARLLLEEPNLLLLDEPTNHLDLEARNWLESYLESYPNAFVLISHDRFFLDVTVTRIAEIWNKRVYFYTGGYSKYEQQKSERRAQLEAAYANQRVRVEQLEAFINRFRAQATKAKQVQSRIKELEKIERIEVPPDEKTIHFSFPQPKPSGRIVAEFRDVSKNYGEKVVFSNATFNIERGDRIALVGVNGAGKSTLIRLLSGEEPVTSGEYALGHNAMPDYFAQDQYKVLDVDSSILDDLANVAPRASNTELRSILGCFLFSEDDVFKKIGVLSGGERNRYALARMLMMPGNFMLLDEPTNHLDMRAKDVLLRALQEFSGTVVFVSHDRYFIDRLATRVIEVADGQVHAYPGNYEDYLWRKNGGGELAVAANPGKADGPTTAAPARKPTTPDKKPQAAPAAAHSPNQTTKPARLNPIKLRQIKDRQRAIEDEITRLEVEILDFEQSLAAFQERAAQHRYHRTAGIPPHRYDESSGGMGRSVENHRGQQMKKIYISEEEVLAHLPMAKAVELVDQAFLQLASGEAINQPRRRVVLPTGSVLHYMAGATPGYFGTKVYSTNPKSGAHFEVLLYRAGDGMPLATFEANHLGQIRTGAASGVATKYLAREDAHIAGIIGSGFQAQTQLEAVANVRKLSEVRVWSRKPERRAEFATRCAQKLGLNVRATDSARECVEAADIVITATNSREPVLDSAWIAPGTHVNGSGSNWADRRELPADLIFGRAGVVAVDSIEVAMLESGDLLIPMREAGLASPAVELSEIAAGKRPGRGSVDQITVFKSNGLAVEDIAVAGYLYEEAVRLGFGRDLS